MNFFEELKADLHHRLRWRRRLCRVLTLGRHFYGEVNEAHVGPVDFTESDETFMASSRQCQICYDMQTVATWQDSLLVRRVAHLQARRWRDKILNRNLPPQYD